MHFFSRTRRLEAEEFDKEPVECTIVADGVLAKDTAVEDNRMVKDVAVEDDGTSEGVTVED